MCHFIRERFAAALPRRLPIRHVVSGAFMLMMPGMLWAELRVLEERVGHQTVNVYQMTVTPAPEPVPALRERLVVRDIDRQPGNAATHYLRLFPESGIDSRMNRLTEKYGEEAAEWFFPGSVPLHALPLDKLREVASGFDAEVENFIAPATLRRDCDWGLGLESLRGPEIVQVLLPEFQGSRQVSRLLALRARVAIADGDYQRAIDQLRMNYRLAENVGSERLLVCTLIGLAEANLGHNVTLELLAADGSPNLYWALAELPVPMCAVTRATQFEMSIAQRMFPILKDAATAQHAPEEWARLLRQTFQDGGKLHTQMPHLAPEWIQASLSAGMIAAYPLAKQRLIASGLDPEQVEAMPVGQVIAVDASREYQRIADELEKRLYEPFHIARRRSDTELWGDSKGVPFVTRSFGRVLAQLLLPAVQAARAAEIREIRQRRALQIIEAIRMHAAEHGTLPTYLDEIQAVAIPVNPVTNEPFLYHVAAGKAILELPASDGLGDAARFEITLKN